MKTLLLLVLSMVAAAREATAQEDAQCVRERAAMVETIRPTPGPTPVFWDSRACRRGSLRPWGKRNAICSSLSDLAPSHTRTGRFRSATARPYRSRSSWP